MSTVTINASVPAGATVRIFDAETNTFFGEAVSDGTGVTVVSVPNLLGQDIVSIWAYESGQTNVQVSPTSITFTP